MRDRLRAVYCPSEMIDQIGGWSNSNVGIKYGLGYTKTEMLEYMNKLTN